MSSTDDAYRLAQLLKEQRELVMRTHGEGQLYQTDESARIAEIRSECVALVDRYFREVLQPILINRFPGKLTREKCLGSEKAPLGAVVQFTQLLNDFFIQVLSTDNDPFWRKTTAVELRNYASIAISNRGVRDALRRRRKQHATPEDIDGFLEDQLAQEIEDRISITGADAADVVEVINQWETYGNVAQKKYARLLRLHYVAGMSMTEVAGDMDASLATIYRWHQEALIAVRQELQIRI